LETIKSIFRFYVNSSIHVALAICSLIGITFIKFGITDGNEFIFLNFVGAIAAYNFVKYSFISRLYHKNLTKSIKAITVLTWISLAFFLYYALKISLKTLLYMLPFVVLTVFYVVPILPNKNNLRSIAGVKIFIIALVWTGVTVVVPGTYGNVDMNLDFLIESAQRFLFIIVLMLPFEIRDLEYDPSELETIPQTIGITRTKVFGSILLILFLLLTALKDVLSPAEIISTILTTTLSLFFLWGTEKEQSKYYCSFWVESIPILWWVILIILTKVI